MDSLCGNKEKYKYISEWINTQINKKDSKLSFNNFLFITGNSGIGKTYSILKICEELNLFVSYITTNNCSSSADLKDIIIKNTTSSLIQVLTNDTRKKIIVIDEFESMLSLDRTLNSTLFNILTEKQYKFIPIICISSLDIIKKIGNIKKKCQIVQLEQPSIEDVFQIMKNKFVNISDDELYKTIELSNCNINQCIININVKKNSNEVFYDKLDPIININDLYGSQFNTEYIVKIILTNPWLYPLRFHENLIKELHKRKSNIKNNHDIYKKFMYRIVCFDLMMYKNMIEDACYFFTSIIHTIFLLKHKNNTNSDIENFTKILSYLSLQKKYIKKYYTSKFPIYHLDNYHINLVGRNNIFFN